jgi:hypothetical protein
MFSVGGWAVLALLAACATAAPSKTLKPAMTSISAPLIWWYASSERLFHLSVNIVDDQR